MDSGREAEAMILDAVKKARRHLGVVGSLNRWMRFRIIDTPPPHDHENGCNKFHNVILYTHKKL